MLTRRATQSETSYRYCCPLLSWAYTRQQIGLMDLKRDPGELVCEKTNMEKIHISPQNSTQEDLLSIPPIQPLVSALSSGKRLPNGFPLCIDNPPLRFLDGKS